MKMSEGRKELGSISAQKRNRKTADHPIGVWRCVEVLWRCGFCLRHRNMGG